MTRQYIGARYVPKFAEPIEWDNLRGYEALTIVTYQGTSYTSKKNVPVGIALDNKEYWVATGNYNSQVEFYRREVSEVKEEVSVVKGEVSEVKETLGDVIRALSVEYFKGKNITIIGDSISDNTTYPPNWTIHFTDKINKIGGVVNNIAQNGASFASWANPDNIGKIPNNSDIYIILLGVNDWQGQFPFVGASVSDYNLNSCMKAINDRFADNADVFYISPIKCFMPTMKTNLGTLNMYRHMMEVKAINFGWRVISGDNAPLLSNKTKLTYMGDDIHPNSTYAPILADYIFNAILSRISTISVGRLDHVRVTPSTGSGYIDMFIDTASNEINIELYLHSAVLTQDWSTIVDLSSCGVFKYPNNIISRVFVNGEDKTISQLRLENGKIQIYGVAKTTTLIGGIKILISGID